MDELEIQSRAQKYESVLQNHGEGNIRQSLLQDAACHSRDDFNKIVDAWKHINDADRGKDPNLPEIQVTHDVQLGPLGLGNVKDVVIKDSALGYAYGAINGSEIEEMQKPGNPRMLENQIGMDPLDNPIPVQENSNTTTGPGSVLHWARNTHKR